MKGYLTVFLSLTLGILTTFVMVLIGHAVQNGCKVRLECVTDIGMNSTLGEYQIALFERYGLLYIDTSYETQEPSVSNLEKRLHFYLSQNTKEEANSPWGSLAVQEVSVYDAVTAAYGYGNSMKYQAMQVAKETKGKMGAWADFKRIDEIAGLDGSNMFDEWGALMAQIAEMELPQILNEKGEWEIVPLANPADGIYALAGGDILYQAGIRAEGISATRIQKSDYISERAEDTLLRFGRIGIKETDTDLFLSYLFDKMGNYGRLHKESLLDLQLEYVAMGKASDYDNLRAVVGKLFLWRFAANADAVFGNAGLYSEASGLAASLYAVQLAPYFMEPVTQSILFACAYLETVGDIRCLLTGGAIALQKKSLHVGVENVLMAQIPHISGDGGLTYEEYLYCMLLLLPEKIRNLRVMDVMEMDIRMISGNPRFAMDYCVERYTAEIQAVSGKYNQYRLVRTYGFY